MRENRPSGSMSGMWKQSMVEFVRHRLTKVPATDRLPLNRCATSRLHVNEVVPLSSRLFEKNRIANKATCRRCSVGFCDVQLGLATNIPAHFAHVRRGREPLRRCSSLRTDQRVCRLAACGKCRNRSRTFSGHPPTEARITKP